MQHIDREMEKGQQRAYRAHYLILPYPDQGHINPMLQFSKLLDHKGVKVTLVTTRFLCNTMPRRIPLETISYGYDEGGRAQAESIDVYLESLKKSGSQTLAELLEKLSSSGLPSCVVDTIYCHVKNGLLKLLVVESEISLPGFPTLKPSDLPSFLYDFRSYLGAYKLVVVDQFPNVDKADWVLCNTFYELEGQAVDWTTKFWPMKTIGPTIPSQYLDKRLEDKDYGFNMFKPKSDVCMKWLNEQPKGSIVYVSFGSRAKIEAEQMEELAFELRSSKRKFLRVIRESEARKVPKGFVEETSAKGFVISWCPQLEVLAHEAVGCFITHCGWNSTLEALGLGVPMVAMPRWTDQNTNAKYIMDVWKIGIRAQVDEKGIVRQEEVEHCVSEILEGERGNEIQKNAIALKELARKAVDEGGSSNKNIDEFIATLVQR
ncbi:putative UDP-glucuronosyl/UDP-glucosyltransferase [Rosa chinensis]|uniref:Glycosyltransferase n=1 Tax=Rosa chinensis TaxID=74649 RepID=A0A2P6PJY8_ROSCH|nr:putative UDP-glucuronosyl/UDP-glucosyltransferase [Rosa chinensis]